MLLVVCACCAVVLYRKVRPEAAKAMAAALLALTIIPAGYLMYDKCTTSEAVTYMSLAAVDDLPGQVGGGEYLPTEDTTTDDSVWGRLTPEADDGVELTEYTKNGLTIQLAAQNTGDTEASIRLPLFYYPGYHMTAADGAALTHKNGYLTVTLAPGWQGQRTGTLDWNVVLARGGLHQPAGHCSHCCAVPQKPKERSTRLTV